MPVKPETVPAQIYQIIHKQSQDGLRVGQIFENAFSLIRKDGKDPFYISNGELLTYLEEKKTNNKGP
jgi:hypothetical protein